MSDWSTEVATAVLAEAANHVVTGELDAARDSLRRLPSSAAAVDHKREFARQARAKAKTAREPRTRVKLPKVSLSTCLTVFRRDGFTCQYCGAKTVFVGSIAALGLLFPDAVPYDFNWNMQKSHALLWVITASLDHIVPGLTNDESNLVNACSLCNYTKGTASIEELGWRDPRTGPKLSSPDWEGILPPYPELVRVAGCARLVPHKSWIPLVPAARRTP